MNQRAFTGRGVTQMDQRTTRNTSHQSAWSPRIILAGLLMLATACVADNRVETPSATRAFRTIELSKDAVGPITSETPFDQETIKNLLPDFLVEKVIIDIEGDPHDFISVSQAGGTVLLIRKGGVDGIRRISIKNARVSNTLGPQLSARFETIYDRNNIGACRRGLEAYSRKVGCPAPNAPNVTYWFDALEWILAGDGARIHTPPYEALKKLALDEMTWRPAKK
jgi:hypothetical protein